jgi:hypothetical protein
MVLQVRVVSRGTAQTEIHDSSTQKKVNNFEDAVGGKFSFWLKLVPTWAVSIVKLQNFFVTN